MILRITRNGIRYTYTITDAAFSLHGPHIEAVILWGTP